MSKADLKVVHKIEAPAKGIEVTYAHLHQSVIINPVLGQCQSLNGTKQPGIKMYLAPEGLWVFFKSYRTIIPAANVGVCQLADAEV